MTTMRNAFITILLAGVSLALPARGDAINPIIDLSPGGTVSPLPDWDDANLLLNTITETTPSFGSGSAPTGLLDVLVTTSPFNPFGASDLVFAYDLLVETGDVISLSVSGFSGFEVAVKQSTDGGTLAPALDATMSADGNTITFDFSGIAGGPGIAGGGTNSASLDVYTNATYYSDPLVTITDASGSTAQFDTLGPAPVPEPSSLSLCALSLCLLCFLRLVHLQKR